MRLWVSEHNENGAAPPFESYVIDAGEDEKEGKVLYAHTRRLRLLADDYCLVAFGDDGHWTRLAPDVAEWFAVGAGHRGVRVRVKAEE